MLKAATAFSLNYKPYIILSPAPIQAALCPLTCTIELATASLLPAPCWLTATSALLVAAAKDSVTWDWAKSTVLPPHPLRASKHVSG